MNAIDENIIDLQRSAEYYFGKTIALAWRLDFNCKYGSSL